jgi:membrane associated rhomboid family serine protease
MTDQLRPRPRSDQLDKYQTQIQGLVLLGGMVLLMWIIEIVNTLDSNGLDNDGIWARNFDRIWGIFTSPFLHVSFAHLIANTIPLIFMGVIIALHGAKRLALVTLIVIVVGGIGTWLVSPSHTSAGVQEVTVGASGLVFGYATYLLIRGLFDRSVLEVVVGIVVGVVWGGALISSIVPHYGVSWQAHVCGAIGGLVAAYVLRRDPRAGSSAAGKQNSPAAGALPG